MAVERSMVAAHKFAGGTIAPVLRPKHSNLVHSNDSKDGFRRIKKGHGFLYLNAKGKIIRNTSILRRIRLLAIPPAWTDVWICPHANGHLQATGHDARGRKQYRYHVQWRKSRDQNKYNRLVEVAAVLPRLRRRIQHDLQKQIVTKDRVVATVVRALETTLIRIGNEEYAKANGSYGLTTIQNGHAKVRGDKVRFSFRGKSGKHHVVECNDAKLAKTVKRCQELPGRELFGYVDEQGHTRDITSTDVNNYLRQATGADITAKDFRTWAGTLLAAKELGKIASFKNCRPTKRAVSKVIEAVAEQLGNTKAICQKCYIHPAVLESFMDGSLLSFYHLRTQPSKRKAGLRLDESALLHLLLSRKRRVI